MYILISFESEKQKVKFPKIERDHRMPNTTYTEGIKFADPDPWKLLLLQVHRIDFNDWINHIQSERSRRELGLKEVFVKDFYDKEWRVISSTYTVSSYS